MSRLTVKEKAKKYNCNGKCYIDGCCPNIDDCPETANKEFVGTMLACATIVGVPVLTIAVILVLILS